MKNYFINIRSVILKVFVFFCICLSAGLLYAQSGNEKEWTDNQFPSYIRRMNQFGERPDWSHDGKKILFVSKSFGDVFEMDVSTGALVPLTHHYYHGGYLRALYLSNGDILLLGPKTFPSDNWQEARFKLTELWILSRKLDGPPVRLGEFIWEGPAVSRTQLKIAWAQHHGNYPAQKRYWQIWVADIDYSTGAPQIKNQHVVLDNSKVEVKDAVIEPQNFRPGNEDELTVQSSNNGTEVLMLNIKTGELNNFSNSPGSYDEPEGIFPDGKFTLVESSRHVTKESTARNIDLYKLKLDKSSDWQRLTYFNAGGKFKATNPVISDDGKFMAFMVARCDEMAGIGHGIYIMDIEKYEQTKR
jgi:Tol biopolymer transport system component